MFEDFSFSAVSRRRHLQHNLYVDYAMEDISPTSSRSSSPPLPCNQLPSSISIAELSYRFDQQNHLHPASYRRPSKFSTASKTSSSSSSSSSSSPSPSSSSRASFSSSSPSSQASYFSLIRLQRQTLSQQHCSHPSRVAKISALVEQMLTSTHHPSSHAAVTPPGPAYLVRPPARSVPQMPSASVSPSGSSTSSDDDDDDEMGESDDEDKPRTYRLHSPAGTASARKRYAVEKNNSRVRKRGGTIGTLGGLRGSSRP